MANNKESVRRLTELREAVAVARRILVVTHDNPDPDSVASAAAFQQIFRHMDKDAEIGSGGELGRSENRTMCRLMGFDLLSIYDIDLKSYDFFLFVDTQPGSGNNSLVLPEGVRYGIIDHHIPGVDWPHDPCFADIREHYGATATIAYEYLLARNLKVDVPLATALYYAIRTETSDMGRGGIKADRDVYLKLHSKLDWEVLHEIVQSRVSANYFVVMKEAVERARQYGEALVVDLGPVHHPDIVAEVADSFMRLENINWVMVWGWREQGVVFSLRHHLEPHAGRLARRLVEGLGSAGGHTQMAGGQVSIEGTDLEERRLQFRRTIVPAYLKAVGQPVDNGIALA